jgi:hypothetical protein
MSTTLARQGGQIWLQQSDMLIVLMMAIMAKGGLLCAAQDETQYIINTPCAEVWAKRMQKAGCSGYGKVKGAIERHQAMVHEIHMHHCLPS